VIVLSRFASSPNSPILPCLGVHRFTDPLTMTSVNNFPLVIPTAFVFPGFSAVFLQYVGSSLVNHRVAYHTVVVNQF